MDINALAQRLNINSLELENYFNKFAKIKLKKFNLKHKLIVVTSINPTLAGEGKTSLLIGLVDAMNAQGYSTIGALRQPSIGPTLGMKGGATGGGYSSLKHQALINLNFTGDFYAISTANNLISTIIENEIYYNTKLNIDVNQILWNRCVDLNDRGLRSLTVQIHNDLSYATQFNITAASDLMALFCLCNDEADFQSRLNNTIVAYSCDHKPIKIKDLNITAAIMAVLQQALVPNLVMTNYNNPIIMHGGPFANIAHGCNSIIATKTALSLGEYVITECGFGSDLGFEKFMDIKMQTSGLFPHLVIICATIKALKHHGQAARTKLQQMELGFKNLLAHVSHVRQYGLEPLIILNQNNSDEQQELEYFKTLCTTHNLAFDFSNIYNQGLKATKPLVNHVINHIKTTKPKFLYDVKQDKLITKIENICHQAYHATEISIEPALKKEISKLPWQDYYVCIAKTQYSLSSDAKAINFPDQIVIKIAGYEINHAAKLIIIITEKTWKMPGLPLNPNAKDFK